ncbi:MAG: hypothetical protein LBJ89_04225 [Holosporales bacterium]|jgi:hypothetical protein|nr:hypothetical protein [Holosporales bacterium]
MKGGFYTGSSGSSGFYTGSSSSTGFYTGGSSGTTQTYDFSKACSVPSVRPTDTHITFSSPPYGSPGAQVNIPVSSDTTFSVFGGASGSHGGYAGVGFSHKFG